MTVRDAERYLAAALESVLAQSVPPDEVIVVDDGSSDGTIDVLRGFGSALTVVPQPPSGFGAGVNRAVREAHHEVVAFLDGDDLMRPQAVEQRLARLDGPDAPDVVGGSVVQFVSPELPPTTAARFRFDPGPTRAALLGALLVRRECFARHGPLDETLPLGAGVDWIARLRRGGVREAWIDEVVLSRRIHEHNISHVHRDEGQRAMLAVARRHHRGRSPDASE